MSCFENPRMEQWFADKLGTIYCQILSEPNTFLGFPLFEEIETFAKASSACETIMQDYVQEE